MMEKIISNAINTGECLGFEYDDHPRVLNPYILYRTHDGEILVEGAQVGGDSESRSMPFWRSFNLNKIKSLEIAECPESTHGSDKIMPDTEEKYNPDNDRYAEIICAKDAIK